MTEEKKIEIAKKLAELCWTEGVGCVCPNVTGGACPFTEKVCGDIIPEDWLEWMEDDNA